MNAKFVVLLSTITLLMNVPAIAQESSVAIKTTSNYKIQPTASQRSNLQDKLQPVEMAIVPVQKKQKQDLDRLQQIADSVKINPATTPEQEEEVALIKVSF